MFEPWLRKNRSELKRRFPKFEKFLNKQHYFDYTTSAFAIAVLHEFILISFITIMSLWYDQYHWWFGAFMAYFLHLFVHIGQWIIYKKYVPVIITSILTLPYCFYTFKLFLTTTAMDFLQMLMWTIIGIIITVVSFPSAFFFASKFDRWVKENYYKNEKTNP